MISQIHPSPATWVIFERDRNGELRIEDIGQFLTGFYPRRDGLGRYQLVARFRTAYHDPYWGRQTWTHTPAYLGLVPSQRIQRWYDDYEAMPPTEGSVHALFGHERAINDLRDPYLMWEPRFLVKIQHAHRVLGCTPGEFRRVHLAEFKDVVEVFADILLQNDEDDLREEAERLLLGP